MQSNKKTVKSVALTFFGDNFDENLKRTYHKECSFASNYRFFFLENLFQFQKLLKRVNLKYQRPKCQYSYFS